MKRRLVGGLKRLPGLRQLVAERDGWRTAFAELEAEARQLRREREALRSALARARLDLSDWQPAYIQNKPAAKSQQNWEDFLRACEAFGGLQADSEVLDIGCGVGGMAQQLLGVLGSGGRYQGLDVDPRAIAVCNAMFEQANFSFTAIDVRNDEYNPSGIVAPTEFAFPFEDAVFDLVIARSLFTHMRPVGAARYCG